MVQNRHFPEIHGNFGFGCMHLPIRALLKNVEKTFEG